MTTPWTAPNATPEKRAEAVFDAWFHSDTADAEGLAILAAAIRTAVAEEREACAEVAASKRLLVPIQEWARQRNVVCVEIADSIRDRAKEDRHG